MDRKSSGDSFIIAKSRPPAGLPMRWHRVAVLSYQKVMVTICMNKVEYSGKCAVRFPSYSPWYRPFCEDFHMKGALVCFPPVPHKLAQPAGQMSRGYLKTVCLINWKTLFLIVIIQVWNPCYLSSDIITTQGTSLLSVGNVAVKKLR